MPAIDSIKLIRNGISELIDKTIIKYFFPRNSVFIFTTGIFQLRDETVHGPSIPVIQSCFAKFTAEIYMNEH